MNPIKKGAERSAAYPDAPRLADLFGQSGAVGRAAGENPFFRFGDCRLAPSKRYQFVNIA